MVDQGTIVVPASRLKLVGQFRRRLPRDLDALLAKQPRWKRAAIRANLKMVAAPVNIPQANLGMKISTLLHEIERRRLKSQ